MRKNVSYLFLKINVSDKTSYLANKEVARNLWILKGTSKINGMDSFITLNLKLIAFAFPGENIDYHIYQPWSLFFFLFVGVVE